MLNPQMHYYYLSYAFDPLQVPYNGLPHDTCLLLALATKLSAISPMVARVPYEKVWCNTIVGEIFV